MKTLSRPEGYLALALLAALALACFGPSVAQHAHYHAFADQRGWLGLPCAMDVLSNLLFALAGLWGLLRVWQARVLYGPDGRWSLAAVFFAGLLVTAVGMAGVFGIGEGRFGQMLLLTPVIGLGYQFSWGAVSAGYRVLDYNFKSGGKVQDLSASGPEVAFTFRF